MSAASLSIQDALDILGKLAQAAPDATAQRLRQIQNLIQNLEAENDYLNTLAHEQNPLLDSAPALPTAPPEETSLLLAGLNEGLRAPLIAIRGRAELIQAGLLGQITPEQNQWLGAIEENTHRAFALLDTMQQIHDVHTGKVRIELTSFIPTDLLTNARERALDAAEAREQQLDILMPQTVPMTRGDFFHTLMILTDMLDNAIHYMPPGGEIRLSVDNLGSHVLFSVVDQGIGLTPDDLRHVGEPFWRGQHRLVRQHPGSGLRLFLARHLLALQGGELIFSGEPGLGSTFSFTLPITG